MSMSFVVSNSLVSVDLMRLSLTLTTIPGTLPDQVSVSFPANLPHTIPSDTPPPTYDPSTRPATLAGPTSTHNLRFSWPESLTSADYVEPLPPYEPEPSSTLNRSSHASGYNGPDKKKVAAALLFGFGGAAAIAGGVASKYQNRTFEAFEGRANAELVERALGDHELDK